jgi:hypothetical protein
MNGAGVQQRLATDPGHSAVRLVDENLGCLMLDLMARGSDRQC